MDRNPNHFPTLLAVCILMAIILYVISHVVYFFHQWKNLLNAQTLVTDSSALSPECSNEEEQQMGELSKEDK
jgi:hypothetical protein